MTSSPSQLLVSICDDNGYIKVVGRANVQISVAFKRCLQELQARGVRRFCMILDECQIMDSTFVGILAGFCRKMEESAESLGKSAEKIILHSPNNRVSDLIENLGIGNFFLVTDESGQTCDFETVRLDDKVDKRELTRHSLEAHKNLMELNPDNIPKFKDVTKFLEEDLR